MPTAFDKKTSIFDERTYFSDFIHQKIDILSRFICSDYSKEIIELGKITEPHLSLVRF